MDIRQSIPFKNYLERCGWKSGKIKEGYIYVYKMPLIGNLVRIPRVKNFSAKELEVIKKKYSPVFIKIEPDSTNKSLMKQLKMIGFRQDFWSIEPTRTLQIDLSQEDSVIFSQLKPKWRQNIRFASKNDLLVKQTDIETFIKTWQQNAMRKNLMIESPHQTKVLYGEFKKLKNALLLGVFVKHQAVGSALLLFSNKTCHLWHLAYNGTYKNYKPLHLLVWHCLLSAKKEGAKCFDFEGIEDARYPYSSKTQPTFFKKGFGGKEKEYLGSFIKTSNPAASLIYESVSRVNPAFFRLFFKSIPSKS